MDLPGSGEGHQFDLLLVTGLEPHRGAGRDIQTASQGGIPVETQGIVGFKEMESWGGTVVTVPLLEGYSTTSLIQKMGSS